MSSNVRAILSQKSATYSQKSQLSFLTLNPYILIIDLYIFCNLKINLKLSPWNPWWFFPYSGFLYVFTIFYYVANSRRLNLFEVGSLNWCTLVLSPNTFKMIISKRKKTISHVTHIIVMKTKCWLSLQNHSGYSLWRFFQKSRATMCPRGCSGSCL